MSDVLIPPIYNLRKPGDLEKQRKRLQKSVNFNVEQDKKSENAFNAVKELNKYNITPVAPSEADLQEMRANQSTQFNVALGHLKSIMAPHDATTVARDLESGNQLSDFNAYWPGFQKMAASMDWKLKGPTYFKTYWNTFVTKYANNSFNPDVEGILPVGAEATLKKKDSSSPGTRGSDSFDEEFMKRKGSTSGSRLDLKRKENQATLPGPPAPIVREVPSVVRKEAAETSSIPPKVTSVSRKEDPSQKDDVLLLKLALFHELQKNNRFTAPELISKIDEYVSRTPTTRVKEFLSSLRTTAPTPVVRETPTTIGPPTTPVPKSPDWPPTSPKQGPVHGPSEGEALKKLVTPLAKLYIKPVWNLVADRLTYKRHFQGKKFDDLSEEEIRKFLDEEFKDTAKVTKLFNKIKLGQQLQPGGDNGGDGDGDDDGGDDGGGDDGFDGGFDADLYARTYGEARNWDWDVGAGTIALLAAFALATAYTLQRRNRQAPQNAIVPATLGALEVAREAGRASMAVLKDIVTRSVTQYLFGQPEINWSADWDTSAGVGYQPHDTSASVSDIATPTTPQTRFRQMLQTAATPSPVRRLTSASPMTPEDWREMARLHQDTEALQGEVNDFFAQDPNYITPVRNLPPSSEITDLQIQFAEAFRNNLQTLLETYKASVDSTTALIKDAQRRNDEAEVERLKSNLLQNKIDLENEIVRRQAELQEIEAMAPITKRFKELKTASAKKVRRLYRELGVTPPPAGKTPSKRELEALFSEEEEPSEIIKELTTPPRNNDPRSWGTQEFSELSNSQWEHILSRTIENDLAGNQGRVSTLGRVIRTLFQTDFDHWMEEQGVSEFWAADGLNPIETLTRRLRVVHMYLRERERGLVGAARGATSSERVLRPRKGKGIYRRGLIIGRGIAPDDKPRFKQFGRYVIHIPSLEKNVLNIKFPSDQPHPKLPRTSISDELRELLENLLKTGKLDAALFTKLTEKERNHFEYVVAQCQIARQLGLKEDAANEMNRFQILQGEMEAGNNNPVLLRELKNLTFRLIEKGKISKEDGAALLVEIAV